MPLTLTLSRGEREQIVHGLDFLPLPWGEGTDCARTRLSPSPWGEGRGEGKIPPSPQISPISSRHANFLYTYLFAEFS